MVKRYEVDCMIPTFQNNVYIRVTQLVYANSIIQAEITCVDNYEFGTLIVLGVKRIR